MKKYSPLMFSILLLLFITGEVMPQNSSGIYIDPNWGSRTQRKTMIMNSNQVESIIENKGTFGRVGERNVSGAWPKGTGHSHVHNMSIIVSASVISKGKEYHITSDSYENAPDQGANGKEYFWNPLPGYANDKRYYRNPSTGVIDAVSTIANANDPTSFPLSWPGKDNTWNGRWNGYFGKDQFTADQECLFVIDDSYNSEFPYYPFASDTTKRGLGLQVETRMFQWAHPLAEDEIFIHFQVSNRSDFEYNRNIFFGAFADTHPGGLGDHDDNSGFSKDENFVYAWDNDNRTENWTRALDILPGYVGWKYLESPGIPDDGIDNDNDGLIDEKRDNDAGQWILGPVGKYGPEQWHWSGDENGNWMKESDDVGSDGIGPLDLNYIGPDLDGTEGNGKPDQGEPNFGKTDKDESDQIGLTSFYSPAYGSMNCSDDEQIWNFIQPGVFETPAQNTNNMWVFSSGPFILNKNKTERFSVCWVFGINSVDILRNAQVAQKIYNNSYRFTKPPLTPTLTAVPGNKKVTLYWDDLAERSVDPIYGKDFEGYKIFRGTNSQFEESRIITDAYGSLTYRSPIAQFDLKDGIKGIHPVAIGSELGDQYSAGIHYNMGSDSGLRHHFIDSSNVINGVTYYYTVVAYDKGYYNGMDERGLSPMSPSESALKITENTVGDIVEQSANVVRVVPNTLATNYLPGSIDTSSFKQSSGSSTSSVSVAILDPDKLKENHNYELTFDTKTGIEDGIGLPFATSYSLRDLTTNQFEVTNADIPYKYLKIDPNNPVKIFEWEKYDTLWTSGIFSGMVLNFNNSVPSLPFIRMHSGWKPGSQSTCDISINYADASNPFLFPINFKVEFTENVSGKSFTTNQATATFDTFFNIKDSKTGESVPYYLKENLFTKNGKWDKTEKLYVGLKDSNGKYKFPWVLDILSPFADAVDPQSGDIYNFVAPIPFTKLDKYVFSTTASKTVNKTNLPTLDKIKVVPNPYILAASWDRSTASNGRGDRRISFIHLPSECTIRIYTQNGILLKTIYHSGSASDGSEFWNLTTEENLEVSFGIYVFHVDAKELGQKIGTFAIIN